MAQKLKMIENIKKVFPFLLTSAQPQKYDEFIKWKAGLTDESLRDLFNAYIYEEPREIQEEVVATQKQIIPYIPMPIYGCKGTYAFNGSEQSYIGYNKAPS